MPAASRYRPRHPRASPVWQVLHDHWDDFRRAQAIHDDHLDQTVQAACSRALPLQALTPASAIPAGVN